MSESHISDISVHKYPQIVVLNLIDPFKGLFSTVRPKMTQSSYLRHFSAQVSQIVFLALFDSFIILLQLYEL